MACTIIGTIRIPATVGQAVRVNGKKCTEETMWTIADAYGGESYITDFVLDNRANVAFDIEVDFSAVTDDYTIQVLDELNNPVTFPFNLAGKDTKNWKLKITFNKYIEENTYEILAIFDFYE